MSVVDRVERTREQQQRRRRRQRHLAIGLDGDAIDFARQQPVDRVCGRDDRFGIMLIRIEEALRRGCGNPAGTGQPQDNRARDEVFLGGAIPPALGQHAGAVRDLGGVGEGDVKSMLAFARAVADQRRRGAQAHQVGAQFNASARRQPGGARPCALRHRDRGVGAARLCRGRAEKRRKRPLVVGNLRLDQQPRAAGNAKQLADRPAAAAGDRERGLAAGPVHCGDQLPPRGVQRVHGQRAHGVCGPKLKNTTRTVKDSSDRVEQTCVRPHRGRAAPSPFPYPPVEERVEKGRRSLAELCRSKSTFGAALPSAGA